MTNKTHGCSLALGVLELGELLVDVLVESVEVGSDFLFGLGGQLELHLGQLEDDVVGQLRLDVGHGELLLLSGGGFEHLNAVFVEFDDGLHHAHSLVQGAVVVGLREGVLLQELVLNDRGSL